MWPLSQKHWSYMLTLEKHLDSSELELKSDARPGRRFLYYNFITGILRAIRYRTDGCAGKKLANATGRMWTTPGPI